MGTQTLLVHLFLRAPDLY